MNDLKSIGEIVAENTQLRDEALAWHKRAHELEIKNAELTEQINKLAIENVKLLNRPPVNKARQYEQNNPS